MAAPQSLHDGSDIGQHSMRVVGRVYGPGRGGMDCESPLLAKCVSCAHTEQWNCRSASEAICRPCSVRNRRRVIARASDGLFRSHGFYVWLTVTAPSELGQHCKKKGCSNAPSCGHRLCDCTPVGGVDLAVWNAHLGVAWNRLMAALRDRYGDIQFMGGVEPQDGKRREDGQGRGALHRHVLAHMSRKITIQELRRLAVQAGFGHSVELEILEPGSRKLQAKVEYLAKYVTKGATLRPHVPWKKMRSRQLARVNRSTGEVHTITEPYVSTDASYKAWTASRKWGRTMKELRAGDAVRVHLLKLQGWSPGSPAVGRLAVTEQRQPPATESPPLT